MFEFTHYCIIAILLMFFSLAAYNAFFSEKFNKEEQYIPIFYLVFISLGWVITIPLMLASGFLFVIGWSALWLGKKLKTLYTSRFIQEKQEKQLNNEF